MSLAVRADIHTAFNSSTWVLVPEEGLLESIRHKIEQEKGRRKEEGTTGPWPDFRSSDVSSSLATGFLTAFIATEISWIVVSRAYPTPVQIYFRPFDPRRHRYDRPPRLARGHSEVAS
jgi:hypothetical protein